MTSLLGIDLGTSSVRALLVDPDGTVLALNGLDYTPDIPRPGFAEQDPDFWAAMAFTTISRSLADARVTGDGVRALSFSGQMHGLVCVDTAGKPLRPAIIWQDQRSKHVIRDMYDRLGRDVIGGAVQNTVATGFLLASLVWLKENEPETYGKIYRVMLPKDYLKFRLSGVIATDFSDAAGTTAFDNVNRQWSRPLLDALGLDPEMFPEILQSTSVLGTVTPEAEAATGQSTRTLVVNGGTDQCMQAVGNGIVQEGVFSSNIGTGGQMSACSASPLYDPEFRTSTFAHALPERWTVMGAALSAGASMKWLAERVLHLDSFR
ncbi:MAG: xylulokinase, partial [Planctomycetes bacterium]|nr:xylulokinase [Planctomycetota bacterium]